MFIKSTELEGFMPYRDKFRLDFHQGQIIGITGQYGEDQSKSNRAGKSSFIDSQVWCLYGKSRAKKEVELVHNEAEFAKVTCEIFDPTTGHSAFVSRSRTKDNKGTLELIGFEGEKKKATQEMIDKLVGLTYEEFLFTAFFKQNDIDQFMESDSTKKKEILMRWLQSVGWEDYRVKTNAYKVALQRELEKKKALIDGLPQGDVDIVELKNEIGTIAESKKDLNKKIDGFSKVKLDINLQLKELRTIDDKKQRAADIASKIQRLKSQRPDSSKFKSQIQQLDQALAKYPEVTKEKYEDVVHKRDEIVSQIGSFNYEIDDLDDKIKDFGKEMTGVCPILKQACSRIEADPDQLNQFRLQKQGLQKKIAALEAKKEKIANIVKVYQAQVKWKNQKAQIELQLKSAKQLEGQIADLTNQRAEVLKSIPDDAEQKTIDLLGKLDKVSDEQDELQQEVSRLDARLGEIRELIKQHETKKERLEAYTIDKEALEKEIADAQYVEYMFGKNGIPSMELENSYQEIEEDANLILKNLRAPFHMEFEATRQLGEWEPNCLACGTPFEKGERTHKCQECGTDREKKRKDELSLTVYEGGTERQFYMDSGGGKILLSAAIRLALTQLARRRKGTNWGTIYLDEIFGQLDATNRRLMADLITSTLLGSLGFEQVFIISHDPSIQSSMADQLVVKRNQEKGYSELYM